MIVLKNILVPTDFEAAAEAALRYGRTLAETFGADLHVLHVEDTAMFQARFADPATLEATARRQLGERAVADDRQRYQTHAAIERFDSPTEAIVRYARAAAIDLIVMGTHGRSGADRLLMGSVAERVVRSAPCPVLTVRHPERDFITDADADGDVVTPAPI
jgi:nucleotide-binding universal stress UspA family protein